MRHDIVFAPEAVNELRTLPARDRAAIRDAIEVHLRHEPARLSRTRIKRLRGFRKPQFRLRVDNYRVFYDVRQGIVEVLAVVEKPTANEWLEAEGEAE